MIYNLNNEKKVIHLQTLKNRDLNNFKTIK